MNLLMLSIGSNPLPNYITLKYLLSEDNNEFPIPDVVMFVFSNKTTIFKRNIVKVPKTVLSSDKIYNVNLYDDQFRDAKIKNKLLDKLRDPDLFPEAPEHIHFNYTGGTKAMIVGIQFALAEYQKENEVKCEYSYLSPKHYKIFEGVSNSVPADRSLRECITIPIEDLLELHDVSAKVEYEHSSYYSSESVIFLLGKTEDYVKSKKNKREGTFYGIWDTVAEKKKQKAITPKDIEQCLETLSNGPLEEFARKDDTQEFKKLIKYVRGNWLEEYVFDLLNQIRNEFRITDLVWDVNGRIGDTGRGFQVDVFAVKGCQPFLFTCTMDNSATMCKQKAFEGVYRSEQMGGKHSKTILVCCASKISCANVKADMAQFDAQDNFAIIGYDEIMKEEKLLKELSRALRG